MIIRIDGLAASQLEPTQSLTIYQDIRVNDLVAFDTKDEDEIETCRLMNTDRAYHNHINFFLLFKFGEYGCNICLLMSVSGGGSGCNELIACKTVQRGSRNQPTLESL